MRSRLSKLASRNRTIGFATLVFSLVSITFASAEATQEPRSSCRAAWVYFDLGQTLIDTDTYKYDPMFYLPEAREYVEAVIKAGHPVGLIIDIPEKWGRDYPPNAEIKDLATVKVLRTMQFVQGIVPSDHSSWRKGDQPFEWQYYGAFRGEGPDLLFNGRILVPLNNRERKDTGNPVLFERAKAQAAKEGCPILYLSEEPKQLEVARKTGLAVFQVGVTLPGHFFLPVEQIEDYVRKPAIRRF